jgi:hypothetical protein
VRADDALACGWRLAGGGRRDVTGPGPVAKPPLSRYGLGWPAVADAADWRPGAAAGAAVIFP